jgi:hypothetical protein
MSNAHVGAVYDHIIQEVINAVRVDFEENGVDDGILEELKKVRTSLHFPLHSPALAIRIPSLVSHASQNQSLHHFCLAKSKMKRHAR